MRYLLIILCLLMFQHVLFSQSIETYTQQINTLNKQKKYADALELIHKSLKQYPNNYDLLMLETQTLAWNRDFALATLKIKSILKQWPENGDAWLLYSSITYWSENFTLLESVADSALLYNKNDASLLFKKAVAQKETEKYDEAFKTITNYLTLNPGNALAIALERELKGLRLKHSILASYRYSNFDKIFDDWHTASLTYSNYTKAGPLSIRTTFANQFNLSGIQYEVDLYPKISKTVYGYFNVGFSTDQIFPEVRLGGEIFSTLPRGFEVSVGSRWLSYETSDNVWIYTGQIGKYFGNNWISIRPFITDIKGEATFTTNIFYRHYLKGRENYIGLWSGYGSAPVELVSLAEIRRLNSGRIGIEYQHNLKNNDLVKISTEFQDEEYIENFKRKRISFEISYLLRF